MAEYVYLVRNGELYNIGRTDNIEKTKKILEPGKLEAVLQTSDSKSILKILQKNYSEKWLPQSNYFRLSKLEAIECKRQLEEGRSKNDFKPFFSGATLLITFLTAWLGISFLIIEFAIQPIFSQFN
ncbi:GIY-YIG nuclease family protein [Prochlorococcus sp. MIT 1307]|uniref:GIY-YIG nuclease family protein n=1 Tax=Prochlorococcus sp. MIT 1307 TaxID=3096219 RepID=UPI002A762811|nr:GIY-YIG nuclease family protein [Prochlorococcus sp. MIT 1307]